MEVEKLLSEKKEIEEERRQQQRQIEALKMVRIIHLINQQQYV